MAPDDPGYGSYVSFNTSAVARGRQLVGELACRVPIAGSRALHVGAASGGVSIALAEAGASVTAIESDALRYRWAQSRISGHGHQINLVESAPERFPCDDASIDVVVLDDAIEHVADPAAVIAEIGRVLTVEGVAYIVVPNKLSLPHILRDPHYQMLAVVLMPRRIARFYVERIRRHPRSYRVNKIPTRRWLRRHAAAAGMRVELLPAEGLQKLRDPEQIADRYRHVRAAARLADRAGLGGALELLAGSQRPYWRVLLAGSPSA